MNRKSLFQLSAAAAVIALGVGVWWFTREKSPENQGIPSAQEKIQREEGERMAKADADLAVKRREEGQAGGTAAPGDRKPVSTEGLSYGQLKPLAPDASPQVQAAVSAALGKNHPERLTCAILPAAFDSAKWLNESDYKSEYLRIPEPARCYQSAQPQKGVKQIALACPAYIETLQNHPVELSVRATPGMPVTFTSFDAAMFTAGSGNTGSQLTTQTAVADENGIATAVLLATPGVIDDCRVIASCPVNSGLAKITVHAKLPEQKAVATNAAGSAE